MSAVLALLVVSLVAAMPQANQPLRQEDGAVLQTKIARLVANDLSNDRSGGSVVLTQREINAYLQFQAAPLLPVGVTAPHVEFGDGGEISVAADVDLGAVSTSVPRGPFDPMRYLRGVVAVAATGTLDARSGVGQLDVASVSVGGVPVPRTVLRELVAHYSRTDTHPEGFDLDSPFELPYGVTHVSMEPGQAVVTQ